MPSPESAPAAALCACGQSKSRRRESIPSRPSLPATANLLAFCLCLVAALTFTLGGCAAAPPAEPLPVPSAAPAALTDAPQAPSPTPEPVESGPVTIVLWHPWYGEQAGQLLAEMAGRFSESHPGITVQPVCVGSEQDLAEKTMAAIQAGNPPDMALVRESQIAEFMRAGAVVPLEPYLDDPGLGLALEEREDFFAGCWQSGVYPEFGGQMLSFPFAKSALVMYYNRTALEGVGIEQPPKTWEEMEAACAAVSKGSATGLAWRESALTFSGFLYSRAAGLLSADQAQAVFNGPEGVESLDLLLRLDREGYAWQPEGQDAGRAAFAAGEAIFAFGSTADAALYAGAIEEAGSTFAWGAAMLPQSDVARPPRTVLSGEGVCILRTGEARQRAAWQFIRWFTAAEQSAAWSAGAGYLPLRASAVQELAASGRLDESPLLKEICDSVVAYVYPELRVRGAQAIGRAIEEAWVAALNEVKAPQEALDQAAARANEVLASKR